MSTMLRYCIQVRSMHSELFKPYFFVICLKIINRSGALLYYLRFDLFLRLTYPQMMIIITSNRSPKSNQKIRGETPPGFLSLSLPPVSTVDSFAMMCSKDTVVWNSRNCPSCREDARRFRLRLPVATTLPVATR